MRRGYAVGAFGRGTALQAVKSRVSLEFCIDIILLVTIWSWNRLSLWQKWLPGIFPCVCVCVYVCVCVCVKAAGTRADNHTTFVCRMSWSLGVSASSEPSVLSRAVRGFLYRHFFFRQSIPVVFKNTCEWRRMQTYSPNTTLPISNKQQSVACCL
jgi:hypothetical protein